MNIAESRAGKDDPVDYKKYHVSELPEKILDLLALDKEDITTLTNYLNETLKKYTTTIGDTNEERYNNNGEIPTLDIHTFAIPLLSKLINKGYKPYASCQGYIDKKEISPERRLQLRTKMVYIIPETQQLDECTMITNEHEIGSGAYLVLGFNEQLYEKLVSKQGDQYIFKVERTKQFVGGQRGEVISIYIPSQNYKGWLELEDLFKE